MKILVCLKQILDPEIPVRDFKIDSTGKGADSSGANWVANIFCENALEMALQFREAVGVGEVTVLSLGPERVEEALRKALAMKVDHAVRIDGTSCGTVDSLGVAQHLAAAIEKLGGVDLILLGREAGDWGLGQTGPLLAECLGLPLVSFVDEIRESGEALEFRRQTDDGWERFRVAKPVVVTVTNSDDNLPRIPKTRDIMKSSRKPIEVLTPSTLGIGEAVLGGESAGLQVESMSLPEASGECEFVQGDTVEEKVEAFADRITEIVKWL